jgi:hypothetical protein
MSHVRLVPTDKALGGKLFFNYNDPQVFDLFLVIGAANHPAQRHQSISISGPDVIDVAHGAHGAVAGAYTAVLTDLREDTPDKHTIPVLWRSPDTGVQIADKHARTTDIGFLVPGNANVGTIFKKSVRLECGTDDDGWSAPEAELVVELHIVEYTPPMHTPPMRPGKPNVLTTQLP